MSIVTLKKKTGSVYKNMSANQSQFSLQGGYRNQGYVGQSIQSRHYSGLNRGGQLSLENSRVMKPTVSTFSDGEDVFIPACSKSPHPRLHALCGAQTSIADISQADYIASLSIGNRSSSTVDASASTFECQTCPEINSRIPNIVQKPSTTSVILQMTYDEYLQSKKRTIFTCDCVATSP